jgi:hypothetical protein
MVRFRKKQEHKDFQVMTKNLGTRKEEQPVKRLLRRCDTHEYFKEGGWTTNPEEAQTFSDVVEVAEICAQRGLSGVEMTLRVAGGESDVFCTPIR